MRRVILESPYAAGSGLRGLIGRWLNRRYARACVRDSLRRGEAPIASHLLYTQRGILKDHIPAERQWGIDAGLAWRNAAEATAVYVDRGVSTGMQFGIDAAKRAGRPIDYRTLHEAEGFRGSLAMRATSSPARPHTPQDDWPPACEELPVTDAMLATARDRS